MTHTGSMMLSPEAIVAALYEGLLRRPPDREGLELYVRQLHEGESVASLLDKFTDSDEFRAIAKTPSAWGFPLDVAPPMDVQTQVSDEDRRAIWQHIASVWSGFGETDPFWSVLADERWRARNMDDAAAIAAFYETGAAEGQRLDAWLRRNGVTPPANGLCVEYGCGLGRITRALASRFARVSAYDISTPHLEGALQWLGAQGVRNVDYRLVRTEADLARPAEVDLFYSIIVLQHNPPPVMLDILGAAFASLKPGGLAFFQIPTYSLGYTFSVAEYWANEATARTMEMHFLPQRAVLELGRVHGVIPLEIQPDWCIGNAGKWISNTFLMQKEAPFIR